MMSCKECGNTNCFVSDYAAGDLMCTKCGCVAAGRVQDESEDWRAYSNGKEVKGAQHVVTFGELGSAEIKCRSPNMFCPVGARPRVKRSEKFLLRCIQKIRIMCGRLFFQKIVVDTAHSILRSAIVIRYLAGVLKKRRKAFLAATIVIASRKHSCARSLKEISASIGANWNSVAKCYSRIIEKLNIEITPQRPHEYATRFCCLLRIPQAISQVAAQLATRYATSDSPRNAIPTAIAGAAILFISSMSKQRKEVARVAAIAFISEQVLLRIYADMYNKLNELFTTEDLINLQEQGLDMRKLLRPDVVGTWKQPNTDKVASRKRGRFKEESPLDQPRGKITRTKKVMYR